MSTDESAVLVVGLWIVVLAIFFGLAWMRWRPVVGLAIAYWSQLWLIHWIGGLIHALSWHRGPNHSVTLTGFEITGYAMAGLLAGYLIVLFLSPKGRPSVPSGESPQDPGRLPVIYIVSGLTLYFVVGKLFAGTALGFDALVSSGLRLAIAGFCLHWFVSWKAGKTKQAHLILLCSLVIPLLTVGLMGFMGFGVLACITIACFVGVFYRPRWAFVTAIGVVLLVGISVFPTYMRVRGQIRREVWGENSMSARLEKMTLLLTEWEWFNVENKKDLDTIDDRLNQNILIGHAVRYLSGGRTEYARGETLLDAFVALIPRAVWPDKPLYAGSGNLVTRYTGIPFARSTSVGIGHVMELYVNFGISGVLLGYVLLGSLLGFFDTRCGGHLLAGDWKRFTLLFVIGECFLEASGNFAEATASAAGGAALCLLVNALVGKRRAADYTVTTAPGPTTGRPSCSVTVPSTVAIRRQ